MIPPPSFKLLARTALRVEQLTVLAPPSAVSVDGPAGGEHQVPGDVLGSVKGVDQLRCPADVHSGMPVRFGQ